MYTSFMSLTLALWLLQRQEKGAATDPGLLEERMHREISYVIATYNVANSNQHPGLSVPVAL